MLFMFFISELKYFKSVALANIVMFSILLKIQENSSERIRMENNIYIMIEGV